MHHRHSVVYRVLSKLYLNPSICPAHDQAGTGTSRSSTSKPHSFLELAANSYVLSMTLLEVDLTSNLLAMFTPYTKATFYLSLVLK